MKESPAEHSRGHHRLGEVVSLFFKLGCIAFGGPAAHIAMMRDEVVKRRGWLTDRQLLDAIAIGQFTPGPVFTTATFVGYLRGGVTGAILATVAIFLPSFVFVALSHPLIPRLRRSPWMASFLDGVNAAALGLMAAVTVVLARSAVVDAVTLSLAVGALLLLIRFRLNSTWLVLGGAFVGVLAR